MRDIFEGIKFSVRLWLKSLTATAAAFAVANPMVVILTIVAAFALFTLIISFGSCGENRNRKKLENLNAQVENANQGVVILNSQHTQANADSRNAAATTNQAWQNLNAARNRNFNGISGADLDRMANDYR